MANLCYLQKENGTKYLQGDTNTNLLDNPNGYNSENTDFRPHMCNGKVHHEVLLVFENCKQKATISLNQI